MKVISIGYQGKSLDGMCRALSEAGATVLLDVRDRAWSQRPEFRKTRLGNALAEHGIDYRHCKEAGNPHRPRRGERSSAEVCARVYRDHLDEHPEVLDLVSVALAHGRTAVFCYESLTEECHRGVLLEALSERGEDLEVIHL